MAITYAKIGVNSLVMQVITVNENVCKDSNGNFDEYIGQKYLEELYNWPAQLWIRSDDDTINGVHIDRTTNLPSSDQSKALRKHAAEIGGLYDLERDAFLPKKPYSSWIFNYNNWTWNAPVEKPADVVDGIPRRVIWNESTLSWDIS